VLFFSIHFFLSSIIIPIKQPSSHQSNLYLVKNYVINPASYKQLNNIIFTIRDERLRRIVRGRNVRTPYETTKKRTKSSHSYELLFP